MKKYILCILLAASHVLALAVQEYTIKTVPNPKTFDAANFVSNPDGILDTYTLSQVNKILQALEADTKAEVAVVLLNSIGNNNIESFAVKLFEEWGIGKKNLDNGLLILFVLDKRTVRFEVGYGLEGVLPDAICKRIQIQTMIPEFKNGNYSAGILAGVERIVSIVHNNSSNEVTLDSGKQSISIVWQAVLAVCLLTMLISVLWINNAAGRIKKDATLPTNFARYNSLRSKRKTLNYSTVAVVFAGLLLALFFFPAIYVLYLMIIPLAVIPANLYAKAQMRKLRKQPIRCHVCESMMHILPENEDNKFLSPSQDFEERIQSVDYDVFLCNNC
ncbi:MAG: TPM domain-containing protein, partial [Mediterranea sp.]|nr:TPM domain-containing protein [Mediterranea sp.]